jgi:hypothetical protein
MYLILKNKIHLFRRQIDPPGFAGSGAVQTYKSGSEINLIAAGLFK